MGSTVYHTPLHNYNSDDLSSSDYQQEAEMTFGGPNNPHQDEKQPSSSSSEPSSQQQLHQHYVTSNKRL